MTEYIILAWIFSFLGVIIAACRGHKNTLAIFMLGFFFGWTIIGGFVAVVWACTNNLEVKQ